MKACRKARVQIEAGLDRQLDLEERFRLDRHLEECPACREHERRGLRVAEWVEGPADRSPVVPDVDVAVRRVFAALDRGEGRPWRPRRRRMAWLVAAGVAAALVLLILVQHRPPRDKDAVPGETGAITEGQPGQRAEPAAVEPTLAESPLPVGASNSEEWTPAGIDRALRAALLESFPDGQDPRAGESAHSLFLERMRDPARAGWPLRPLVEGLLEHRDVVLARAAARCLGAMGDSGSAAALERALDRAAISEPCFDALASLGEASIPALERAMGEPGLALRALNRLCSIGGERAALAIERRLQRTGNASEPSRASLLDGLTLTGRSAVAGLLRLAAAASAAERDQVLARLELVDGAPDELARLLEAQQVDSRVIYPALTLLRPVTALPWLEARCAQHRERRAALATLAVFPGVEPLESVRSLWATGRVTREDALDLLRNLAGRDDLRVLADTERLIERGDAVALYDWNLLLIESEHPGAASSLAALAFCDALGPDDRQWAALAVGELGNQRDARLLADLLRGRETEDRRRTAACLITIHAHEGVEGVVRALPGVSLLDLRTLLDTLGREPLAGAIRVHRVARVLDDALSAFSNERRFKKEI